jgi:hypothetical protein
MPFSRLKLLVHSCFASSPCDPGLHRLYCNELDAQPAYGGPFVRLAFASAVAIDAIVPVQPGPLPSGMTVVGGCDVNGICTGERLEPLEVGAAPISYIDVAWTPACLPTAQTVQMCFVALHKQLGVSPPLLRSLPSCVFIEILPPPPSTTTQRGTTSSTPPANVTTTPPTIPATTTAVAGGGAWATVGLVLQQGVAHAVAEEAFWLQPQVRRRTRRRGNELRGACVADSSFPESLVCRMAEVARAYAFDEYCVVNPLDDR